MNGQTIVNKFISHLGEDGTRAHKYWNFSGAWCCGEVAMVFKECGSNLFYDGKKVVYCPTAYAWCKSHMTRVSVSNAKGGDIIYFDWNRNGVPDHIGIVEYVSGSTVHTLEGNTGSPARVRRKVRASYILGIYRPKYEPPKPEDYKVKVDGEWGYHTCLATQYVLGGLDLDGVLGKATVKKIQKKVGAKADGKWGEETCKAMSKFLNISPQKSKTKTLIEAWQKWLNAEIDKKITPTPPTPAPPKEPEKTGYTGTFPSLTLDKSSAQAISDALKWGKEIAEDNRFHYGEYGSAKYKGTRIHDITHSSGCHFCNTNHAKKVVKATKAGYKGENWERTYVCNTFVTAMFAHGAMESTCRTKCKKGSCVGMNSKGRSPSLDSSNNWKYMGKLTIKDLKAGDVLVSEPHMQCVYAPISSTKCKIIEATSYLGPYGSTASNNSIKIKEKKPSYTSVYRFVGTVKGTFCIEIGEISDRVKLLQKFLNWYGDYKLVEDGIFFEATKTAVCDYQNKEGLAVDGQFGAASVAKAKEIKR